MRTCAMQHWIFEATRNRNQIRHLVIVTVSMLVLLAGCSDTNERTLDFYENNPSSNTAIATDGYFVDPQGTYELEIDPDWQANHGSLYAEMEIWYVAPPDDDFAPNINVFAQLAPDLDLVDYMALSIDGGAQMFENFELLSQSIIEGKFGQAIGVMEYTALELQYTGVELHFLAVFFVHEGRAVVATLTSLPDRFEELRSAVEPYMLTLQPIGP